MRQVDSVESAGGRLGAVLSAPRSTAVALGPAGPWLATTPALAREVLTDPSRYDFPATVSRTSDLTASRADTRSGHLRFDPLPPERVAHGRATFVREWERALLEHDGCRPGQPYEAMRLLRRPVARSTTAATLPSLDEGARNRVADEVLSWIDALGPVIAARRPPRRWRRTRRRERAARVDLEDTLTSVGADRPAPQVATFLAAGVQVPIAAGAWLLALLADHPTGAVDPVHAVWETLRLTPPTWVTPRVTTTDVRLGGVSIPAGRVVLVSPLALGRLERLVPGPPSTVADFDPDRWHDPTTRPGAWMPFGAGPHACPGRNLGLALLTHLAEWGTRHHLSLSERVRIDQSRGIFPEPCRFRATPRSSEASR